ncbi:hypothetical protein [Actinokineospora sp. HUAS TT18]|uniref:hypothetical protein n=1 Tax=Actinokineospora sp. HUAS TT18 TaxID=3447451 RepID=UPI003F525AEE
MTTISRSAVRPALLSVVALYVVTLAHHLYGGLAFPGVERLVIALVFTVVIAVTAWTYRAGVATRWARWVYLGLVALWVVVVGVIEGGYNHALFVGLRLFGASSEVFARMYPDGIEIAEASDDLFFQGTGVLTLIAVIPILTSAVRSRSVRAV